MRRAEMAIQAFKNEKARRSVVESYDEVVGTWGTEVKQQAVHTSYGITHCLIAGEPDKPPLFLFHGVGDNSAVMWALNMKALSSRYYCIAVDTLGGPGKSVPNEKYNKAEFRLTEWIDELIDAFHFGSVYLAGVSNGAYMAFRYASVRPERVHKTVCLEGGIVTHPLKSMIRTMLLMFPELLLPTEQNMLRIIKKLSSPDSDVWEKRPDLAKHLSLLMRVHNQKAMFPHELVKYESSQGERIKDKILFLIGDHHRVVKKDMIQLLEKERYLYKIIPGAGHGINHEQPDAVHGEIFRFLSQE
jgi:pimeloyl-ACP methyl ester carboxylesterase